MKEKFVIYPHDGSPSKNLTPQDILIYLTIRRYMNKESMECFPSYATITGVIGAAAKTIKKSVDNLIAEGYLETRREGRKIIYKFNNKNHFEAFSYEFLDKKDLTFTEKAYIAASQQFMKKQDETGAIEYSNKDLSKLIHMPATTISTCNKNLEKKGYLSMEGNVKMFQLKELLQIIAWKFEEQDEKIKKNSDDIYSIKLELAKLKEENSQLKEQLNLKNTFAI